MKIGNVDDNCRTMRRQRNFKIYLNNPSMRAALFAPVKPSDSERLGHLAESAIFSQWQHSRAFRNLRYARWRNDGEVDVVFLHPGTERPEWIGEIKWSDRVRTNFARETRSVRMLMEKHKEIGSSFFTTRTWHTTTKIAGRDAWIVPSALYCYTVGRNITSQMEFPLGDGVDEDDEDLWDENEDTDDSIDEPI